MTSEELRTLDVRIHREIFGLGCEHIAPTKGEYGCALNGWYYYQRSGWRSEISPSGSPVHNPIRVGLADCGEITGCQSLADPCWHRKG